MTSPIAVRARAWVTAPTSRTVCCSGPATCASPLTEIGTSPTPKADSIVNWPGMKARGTPSFGSSMIVNVSAVSCRRSTRRKSRGTIALSTGCTAVDSARRGIGGSGASVEVEQPHLRGHQPSVHHLGNAFHELIPQMSIGVALAAQARPVEGHHAGRLGGAGVECGDVRRHEPGPTHDVAFVGSVEHQCSSGGTVYLDGDPSAPNDEEMVSRVTLVAEVLAGGEADVRRATSDERQRWRVQSLEEGVVGQVLLDSTHVIPFRSGWRP